MPSMLMDGSALVVHRRGRAGEIVDLVDLEIKREGHIVPERLEIGQAEQRRQVLAAPGIIVVDRDDLVPLGDQPLTEVAANEAGATCHEDTLLHV